MRKRFSCAVRAMRHWLLSLIVSDDEKYLLIRALDERIDSMRLSRISEVEFPEGSDSDVEDYMSLRRALSTGLWK